MDDEVAYMQQRVFLKKRLVTIRTEQIDFKQPYPFWNLDRN